MKFKGMQILFNEDGGAGSGGAGGNGGAGTEPPKTYSESEFNDVKQRADAEKEKARNLEVERDRAIAEAEKLKKEKSETGLADKELAEARGKRITELENSLAETTKTVNEIKTEKKALEDSVRKSYIDQLPEEHKGIANLIPTVEGLAEYVKVNAAGPKAGQDAGKPGGGTVDTTNKKWKDLSQKDLDTLYSTKPEEWRKLYKEHYGTNPQV